MEGPLSPHLLWPYLLARQEGRLLLECPRAYQDAWVVVWEDGHHIVVQDAARATDPDPAGPAGAAAAGSRIRVPTAPRLLLLVRVALEPDEAVLAPALAPGVLEQPILVHRVSPALRLSIPQEHDGVADDHVFAAGAHNSAVVHVPGAARADGDGHRALLVEREEQGRDPVLRQLPVAQHAPAGTADVGCGRALFLPMQEVTQATPDLALLRCRVHGAVLCSCVVRPLGRVLAAILQYVLHGQLGGGALAATSAPAMARVGRAGDDLLYRATLVLACVDLRVGANDRGGRERPTGAAGLLVHDLVRGLQVAPTELGG
mmetsp:Transcript_125571/g.349602  ORF Transcript_125571/g.349602 Transcript_125571/m.349602 type:complete len:317 (-) Transcript_125571:489-1439(-)